MVEPSDRPKGPVPIGEDNLNFKHDTEIMNQLDPAEKLVYSTKVLKFNRFGFK